MLDQPPPINAPLNSNGKTLAFPSSVSHAGFTLRPLRRTRFNTTIPARKIAQYVNKWVPPQATHMRPRQKARVGGVLRVHSPRMRQKTTRMA